MLFASCKTANPIFKTEVIGNLEKLDFDINALDDDGLIGPPGGKVSVDYQFCFPKGEAYLEKILAIDPDLQLLRRHIGRPDCPKGQVAAMGSTHKPGHKDILRQLTELDFIEKISKVWYL